MKILKYWILGSLGLLVSIPLLYSEDLVANIFPLGEIASALGYPASGLVCKDVTERERLLYSHDIPEQGMPGIDPNVPPEQILGAVEISAIAPKSFYPIVVTVARRGAFHTAQKVHIYKQIDAQDSEEARKLGTLSLATGSSGGVFLYYMRVMHEVEGIHEAYRTLAIVGTATVDKLNIDLKISSRAVVDGSLEIEKIEGSEKYFENFSNESGSASDLKPFFETLNQIVASSEFAAQFKSAPPGNPNVLGVSETESVAAKPRIAQVHTPVVKGEEPHTLNIFGIILAIMGIGCALILLVYRYSQRPED